MQGPLIPGTPPSGFGLGGSSMVSTPFGSDDDVNPMSKITNIADAFLVMALGLMLALVTAMNVSLFDIREILSDNLQQIEQPEEILDDVFNTENPYVELGRVYQDPTTGKTYVINEDGEREETDSPDWSSQQLDEAA